MDYEVVIRFENVNARLAQWRTDVWSALDGLQVEGGDGQQVKGRVIDVRELESA